MPALDEIEAIPEHLKIGRGLYTDCSDNGIPALNLLYCFYWLRDPGEDKDENLVVQGYENSKIVIDSVKHDGDEVGVRAVMWVDAEKIMQRRILETSATQAAERLAAIGKLAAGCVGAGGNEEN